MVYILVGELKREDEMYWFDILIMVIIGLSVIYSFVKGLIRELFALGAVIFGFIIACRTYPSGKELILPIIHNSDISALLSFIVIFLIIAALIVILGALLSRLIHFVRLGWVNRLIGGFFGLLKGFLISGIICLITVAFIPQGRTAIKRSALAPGLLKLTKQAAKLLPESLREGFEGIRCLRRQDGRA